MQELANSFEKRFNPLRTCFVKGFVVSASKPLPLILRESAKSKSSLKLVIKKQSPNCHRLSEQGEQNQRSSMYLKLIRRCLISFASTLSRHDIVKFKPSSLRRKHSSFGSAIFELVKINSKMLNFVRLHSLKAHDNLSYTSSQEVCHE